VVPRDTWVSANAVESHQPEAVPPKQPPLYHFPKHDDHGPTPCSLLLRAVWTDCLFSSVATAPEILCGEIYSEKVDLWSLGVITYILYVKTRSPWVFTLYHVPLGP
jgi:hypothetical protein